MDWHRFDALTHAINNIPSRRDVLRGLTGVALGLGVARLPEAADARKKRKRRRGRNRKQRVEVGTPNEFGCLSVGQRCGNGVQCCSGVCKGKKGRRTCRVHGAGTCSQQDPGVCSGVTGGCNDGVNCLCLRTTAESVFCGNFSNNALLEVECSTDADCEALGLPRGSACVPVAEGFCAQLFESETICIAPCGLTLPPV